MKSLFSAEELKKVCETVLMSLQVSKKDAQIEADVLVSADLRGVDSHGVARLYNYAEKLKHGLINPMAELKVLKDSKSMVLVDACNGLGQVSAYNATKICIERAKKYGSAVVAVKSSNHFGICAYYAMMAAEEDLVGMVCTNASPTTVPTGGREPVLGTNPFAIAIPAHEEPMVVLDMATTLVARGKIEIAMRKGEKVPLDWACDQRGVPTDDPIIAHSGLMLPAAGHKGYGMALIIDILCGVLTGSAFGRHTGHFYAMDRIQNVGHFIWAFDINRLMPAEEFKKNLDLLLREVKTSEKAEGFDRVYVAGEIEHEYTVERTKNGIPLNPKVVANLREVAEEYLTKEQQLELKDILF